jgi:hypothetical protein
MVIAQGYTWTRVPGTDVEVRVLANRPIVLRYQSLACLKPLGLGTPI